MYTPQSFIERDLPTLHSFMEQNSFATLVTTGAAGLTASHLPFLLDRDQGENGTLIGHMAKANPQWRQLADNSEALVMFHGPHAYISPGWMQEQNVVPTWNYVAVHATGNVVIEQEPSKLLDIIRQYVKIYESSLPVSWQLDSVEPDFTNSLLDAIVGFTIEITSLEGKWKLSQNHSKERRQRIVQGLQSQTDSGAHCIAELMQATLAPSDRSVNET